MALVEGPRRSKKELDRLAVEVARLTFEKHLSPQRIYEALKKAEDVRSARDVRLLLDRACDNERPLIKVTVSPIDPATPVDDDLSDELAKVTGLRRVFVGKTGNLAGQTLGEHTDPAIVAAFRREDHDLHKQLAGIAARHVWGHLRDGDTIAVAPGRGPGFTIDALAARAQTHPKAFEQLKVVSLAGGISRLEDEYAETENVDADNNAGKLAARLDAELRVVQLALFLTPPTEEVIRRTEALYLLGEEGLRIDVAILGFGLLNEEHYLLRVGPHRLRPDTRIVKPELDDLRDILETCPTAIIDLCHYFGVGDVSDDCAPVAADIVARLNAKSVTVKPSVLNAATEKVLVGGGRQKYPALRALLTNPGEVRVTTLVTDELTAKLLLDELPHGPTPGPRSGPAARDSAKQGDE